MINKKLSRAVFIAVMVAVIGFPSVFIVYALSAEKKQQEKIERIDKQVKVYSVKQDTILFNQELFRLRLKETEKDHKKNLDKLHDKMDQDKKDIIKEIRRMHK